LFLILENIALWYLLFLRKEHAGAGGKAKDIYLGPPQFEGFEAVI
jgi:hypothetical protein